MTGDVDVVSIVVDGNEIFGWRSLSITRSAEAFPNSFAVTMTEEFSNSPDILIARPGEKCVVKIDQDVVITGYVDRWDAMIAPSTHDVQIIGRGIGEDLVDCSADLLSDNSPLKGGSVTASNALDLAQKLCAAFGITARCAVPDLGKPILPFQIALGETPYEIIERVARYAGYLVYEDEQGALVLDRVGSQMMASGFAQGVNVEAASASLGVDQRFSSYCVVWSTIDQLREGPGVSPTIKRSIFIDTAMRDTLHRYRPRIIVSAQTDGTEDFAQRMARWEFSRRFGRSQAVHVTCDSWRDSAGMLWQPNRLVPVNLPALKLVNANWIIGSVTFRKDASGTHADLELMPPEAFSVQPSTLNVFDRELNQATAPPSTGP